MATEADKKYAELINKISTEGKWDKYNSNGKVRTVYADGTTAYSKGIFGEQIKFEQGEVPLLTNKKVFWKTALKEMLLFWQHQTVKEKDFKEWNVKVWDEWFKEDGTLGKSYAYQFESLRELKTEEINFSEIENLLQKQKDFEQNETIVSVDYEIAGYQIDYEVYDLTNEVNGDLYLLGRDLKDGSQHVYIVNEGGVFEYFETEYTDDKRSVQIGCEDLVYQSEIKKKDFNRVYKMWEKLIEDYGYLVEERWRIFEYFFKDVYYLPQFFLWREDEEGKKGYKLSIEYFLTDKTKDLTIGRHTAMFLSAEQRRICANNYKVSTDTNTLIRPKISSNQVITLLTELRDNPNSRRLMTSFWNDSEVSDKALQECAWATEWRVREDTLDLILIQRSCDTALGLPFNWIQYYLLQTLIASSLGYNVGTFTHQIGDVHYYDRHEEDLLEQITDVNEAVDRVELKIEKLPQKDFFEYAVSDIQINYPKNIPIYRYEVAI